MSGQGVVGFTDFQHARVLGYEHLLFVSWPHMIESGGERLVWALKESVEDRLRTEGIVPTATIPHAVFLDKPALDPNEKWEPKIRSALCRSVATLVVVAPTYFQSRWCALEWAITTALGKRRQLSDAETLFLLLPFYRGDIKEIIPAEVGELNFLKAFDRKRLLRSRNFKGPAWDDFVDQLVVEMRRITRTLVLRGPRDWEGDSKVVFGTGPIVWTPRPVPVTFPTFMVEGKKVA